MKKSLLLPIFLLGLFSACRDDTPKPEPEPDEYFSFYADGVYYNYPQIKELFWGGQTLEAKIISATVGYQISGRIKDFPNGDIMMSFSGGHIPSNDTMMLSSVGILNFNSMGNNFEIHPPLTGKIIFTERSYSRLTGTFEFQAFKVHKTISGTTITDTIITITDGKFSIIPKN